MCATECVKKTPLNFLAFPIFVLSFVLFLFSKLEKVGIHVGRNI